MNHSLSRKLAIAGGVALVAITATVYGSTAPTVTITSPITGETIYGTFPYTLPLTFEITHEDQGDLNSVQDLTITAQKAGDATATTILDGAKPFAGNNTCVSPYPAGILGCSVNADGTIGTLVVNWQVPSAGTYTFTVSAKHGREGDSDAIEVIFDLQTVSIEYPAPPAIANAYINSLSSTIKKQFTAGVRGCVISDIAQNHGQLEAYGPKPGPYNVAKVQADVKIFSTGCGGPNLGN
jgi:hypothetical protein